MNDDFVDWANENILVIVGHSDKGHDPVDEEKNGATVKVCPRYPGLTCEQHQQATMDMQSGSNGLPKIPSESGVPNSWLVGPDGEVKKLEGAEQQSAGKIQEIAEEWMKKLGDHLTFKKWEKIQESLTEGDKAVEESNWKVALKAYSDVDKMRKKAPESLVQTIDARLATLNQKVSEAFETLKADGADPKARHKAVNDLLSAIRTPLTTGYLPVKTDLEAWLKEDKPPK